MAKKSATEKVVVKEVDPRTLKPFDLNPRSHPKRQRDLYRAFRSGLPEGQKWLGFPLVNSRTGHILNGHMRVEEAIRDGEFSIPVQFIDVEEKMEPYIVQHLDATGYAASIDATAVATLAKMNEEFLKKHKYANEINKLTRALKSVAEKRGGVMPSVGGKAVTDQQEDYEMDLVETSEDDEEGLEPDSIDESKYEPPSTEKEVVEAVVNKDVKFPASNEWGIPDLLELKDIEPPLDVFDRSESTLLPSSLYCHSARPFPETRVGGTLSFFTDDWRFEHIYTKPDEFAFRLIGEEWTSVIGPDFSVYPSWPFALNLFSVYRSRWCLRFWQEFDLPVIPNIQAIGKRTQSIILDTLPPRVPIVAFQTRKRSESDKMRGLIEMCHALVNQKKCKHIVLYGGFVVQKQIHADMPYRKAKIHYLHHFTRKRMAKLEKRAPKVIDS